jgi:hypothetical protein
MGRFAARACKWVFAAAALLAVTGCGGTGDVTGKVTLDGAPLRGGIVTVYDSQQLNHSGLITSDGTYTVAGVPLGKADIAVETSPPAHFGANPRNPPRELWGPYTKIPLRYKDPTKSGFTLEIKRGKQEKDLPLQDEPEPAK